MLRQSVQMDQPLLRKVDAVTFRVPDLESGLAFYGEALGHAVRWRNDEIVKRVYERLMERLNELERKR